MICVLIYVVALVWLALGAVILITSGSWFDVLWFPPAFMGGLAILGCVIFGCMRLGEYIYDRCPFGK